MFWLIWIAAMLVVPIVAGVDVWWKLRREASESPSAPYDDITGETLLPQ